MQKMNSAKEVNIMAKDLKIIAILIVLFSSLLFSPLSAKAQFGFSSKQVQQESHQGVLSTSQGRFAFGQISDSSEDKFMLDTLTGRLWRLNKRTDIGLYLKDIPYRSEDGTCSPLPPETPVPEGKDVKDK
jgi:hypothetical protein